MKNLVKTLIIAIIPLLISPLAMAESNKSKFAPKPKGPPPKGVRTSGFPHESKGAEFVAAVQMGDKITNFWIEKSKQGKIGLRMRNSYGQSALRELHPEDYEYIAAEFKKLPQAPKIPRECERSRVVLSMKEKDGGALSRMSCLGLKTKTSPAYARFVNILAMSL